MTDPTAIVTMATAHSAGDQSQRAAGTATYATRSSAPNAATLVQAAMKPVTGVGAPWYTSGVQVWNGAAPTLNSSPTASRATPSSKYLSDASWESSRRRRLSPHSRYSGSESTSRATNIVSRSSAAGNSSM